jgi:hypothetical protein
MATYRCLASGNTVTFTLPHDIESMKGHGGYVLVDEQGEQVPVEEVTKELPLSAPPKRVGRPRRVVQTA